MILVELALQGIRGFPSLHRIAMKPGLNVARWSSADQRRALIDLLYHTLFPDPARGQSTTALADPDASQSRVALTFYGRDKLGYRLIRDTVTGATKLYRYDDKKSKYRLFSEVSTEVAQFVRVQQQLPDEVAFERLFTFDPLQRPSLAAKARTRSGAPLASTSESAQHTAALGPSYGAPSALRMPMHGDPRGASSPLGRHMSGIMPRPDSQFGGFGSTMNLNNALVQSELEQPESAAVEVSADQKKAELERLRADLATVLRGEMAQVELDRIQLERSELAKIAADIRQLRAQIERLQSEIKPAFRELPDGIGERIRTFETRDRKFNHERSKLSEEKMWLLEEGDIVPRLLEDRYFVVGLLGALACIALASLTERPGIALANLPFATVAAGAAFRWVHELEERYRQRSKANAIQKQIDRLERNHELDTAATRKLMKVLGTTDASDLIDEIDAHESLKSELTRLTSRHDKLLRDPRAARADRDLARLDAAAAKLETDALGASGGTMSAEQIRRRIRVLEQELGLPPVDIRATPRRASDPLMGSSDFISQDLDRSASTAEPPHWIEPSGIYQNSEGQHEVSGIHRLPPMPAPGASMPPTPDIKRLPRVRETSVPGVVAHRTATMDLPEPPRSPSRRPSAVRASEAPDDDDDGIGYAGGYGSGGGSGSSGGASTAAGRELSGGLYLVGMGGGGFSSGGFGGLGGYGGGQGGEMTADVDRSRDLVGAAVDLLQVQVDSLQQTLGPRLGEYLAAFTDKAYRRAMFGPRGEVSVAGKTGDFVRYVELSGETLDLVDTAIKMALVEMVVRDFRIPVFFDDPFANFPAQRRKLVAQMLTYLGSATQVVIATPASDLRGHSLVARDRP